MHGTYKVVLASLVKVARKDLGCEHLKGHLGRLSLGSKGKEGLELQGSRSQGKGRFRLRTYKVVLAALVKVAS